MHPAEGSIDHVHDDFAVRRPPRRIAVAAVNDGIAPDARLLGKGGGKNIRHDVWQSVVEHLIGSGDDRTCSDALPIHAHPAARTAFKNDGRMFFPFSLQPAPKRLRGLFKPLSGGITIYFRSDAAVLIAVDLDILRAVFVDHPIDGFAHFSADFRVPVVQKVPSRDEDALPVGTDIGILRVLDAAQGADHLGFDPKPCFHAEGTDVIGGRPHAVRETDMALPPCADIGIDLVSVGFVVPAAVDDIDIGSAFGSDFSHFLCAFLFGRIPRKVHIFIEDDGKFAVCPAERGRCPAIERHLLQHFVEAFPQRKCGFGRGVALLGGKPFLPAVRGEVPAAHRQIEFTSDALPDLPIPASVRLDLKHQKEPVLGIFEDTLRKFFLARPASRIAAADAFEGAVSALKQACIRKSDAAGLTFTVMAVGKAIEAGVFPRGEGNSRKIEDRDAFKDELAGRDVRDDGGYADPPAFVSERSLGAAEIALLHDRERIHFTDRLYKAQDSPATCKRLFCGRWRGDVLPGNADRRDGNGAVGRLKCSRR